MKIDKSKIPTFVKYFTSKTIWLGVTHVEIISLIRNA